MGGGANGQGGGIGGYGGGGSFYQGLYSLILKGGIQHRNGEVWITEISVGAPVPEATTLDSLPGLAFSLRRRRQR
jgi:hypothetical protein